MHIPDLELVHADREVKEGDGRKYLKKYCSANNNPYPGRKNGKPSQQSPTVSISQTNHSPIPNSSSHQIRFTPQQSAQTPPSPPHSLSPTRQTASAPGDASARSPTARVRTRRRLRRSRSSSRRRISGRSGAGACRRRFARWRPGPCARRRSAGGSAFRIRGCSCLIEVREGWVRGVIRGLPVWAEECCV